MRNDRDRAVRAALWQLAAPPASAATPTTEPLPFFLRAPSVAALWAVTLMTVMGLLVLGRVHVPRRVHGAAVAVRTNADSLALLLLLPATAQPHVRVGQQAVLDTGDREPIVLMVTGIEKNLLECRSGAPTIHRTGESDRTARGAQSRGGRLSLCTRSVPNA